MYKLTDEQAAFAADELTKHLEDLQEQQNLIKEEYKPILQPRIDGLKELIKGLR